MEKKTFAGLILFLLISSMTSAILFDKPTPQREEHISETALGTLDGYYHTQTTKWNQIMTYYEGARDIAIDSNGFIYCVGYQIISGEDYDLALVKFHPNGSVIWDKMWGNTTLHDEGYGIFIDSNDSIYCTGYTTINGTQDLVVVKFYPNGTEVWNATWGGGDVEKGYGVTVDSKGSIYCVGYTLSFGAGWEDLALLKFYPNGTREWNVTWGGWLYEFGHGIILDSNEDIYCVGETQTFAVPNVSFDLAVLKFYPNGTRAWNVTWGGTEHDRGYDITMDSNDTIYCTGYTRSHGAGYEDIVLVKFYPNNTFAWYATWGGPQMDYGYGVALDSNNSIYCTGELDTKLALIKYHPDGTQAWNTTWGQSSWDIGSALAFDSNASIYCAGQSSSNDMILLKYEYIITPTAPTLDPISPRPSITGFIDLNWSEVSGADAYHLYRNTSFISSTNGLTPIYSSVSPNYTDVLTINGTYYYAVVAENLAGNSTVSNCENITASILLNPPNLDPIMPNPDTDGTITLNWTKMPNALQYHVYRNTSTISNLTGLHPIASLTATTRNDNPGSNGYYYYVIVAEYLAGNSTLSNCENVTIAVPPPPTYLHAITPSIDDDGIIHLNWDSIPNATYYIYRNTSCISSTDGLTPINSSSINSYTDFISTNGLYSYIIVVYNEWGNSSISNCQSVVVNIPTGRSPNFGLEFFVKILIFAGAIVIVPGAIIIFYKKRKKKVNKPKKGLNLPIR